MNRAPEENFDSGAKVGLGNEGKDAALILIAKANTDCTSNSMH